MSSNDRDDTEKQGVWKGSQKINDQDNFYQHLAGIKRKMYDHRSSKNVSNKDSQLKLKTFLKSNKEKAFKKRDKPNLSNFKFKQNCVRALRINVSDNNSGDIKNSPVNFKLDKMIPQAPSSTTESTMKIRINIDTDSSSSSSNRRVSERNKSSFHQRNSMFHTDIVRIAQSNNLKVKLKSEKKVEQERDENFEILKKVQLLRYRESIFKAAGKISMDVPLFPFWAFKKRAWRDKNVVTINVGGKRFQMLEGTLLNIPNSKLRNCFLEHVGKSIIYFDRDASCFNNVINFFRTGRLHAPANGCLSFFLDELRFWGINEDLMEPCCYSEYITYKATSDTLKLHCDKQVEVDKEVEVETACSCKSMREKLYLISTSSDNGVLGRWYSLICGFAIIMAIVIMIFSTSIDGRIDPNTKEVTNRRPNEKLTHFFGRTDVSPSVSFIESLLVGFFIADLLTRFTLTPDKFIFYSDTINWIDFIATMSSLLSHLSRNKVQPGEYEAYILLMKVPRVFRLFRLTRDLQLGTEALMLTLRARSSELKLVLVLALISISVYGALIYVVELVNEKTDERTSQFKSVYDGMWFAIVTMATVGYGDFTPKSTGGYLVGFFCILTGIIISQLPVPIFLNKFADFYSQIQSRQRDLNKTLSSNIDPENFVVNGSIRKTIDEVFKKEDIMKIRGFNLPK